MSFYLLPPEGIASYKKLEEYGLKRLQFLLRLVHCRDNNEVEDVIQDASFVEHSDCLIIGTAKDTISHYILRLLIGGCSETATFFYESECTLFRLQLEKMNKEELKDFFQCLEKNLIRLKVSSCYKSPLSCLLYLVQVLRGMCTSWSQLAENMCDDLCTASVCLPFYMALCLVAGRVVDLNKGMVTVPFKLLRIVLVQQYHSVMNVFLRQARSARDVAVKDERIRRLAAVFKRAYRSEFKLSSDWPKYFQPLSLPELSSSEAMFPPCMNNLMKVLRQHHRLKHHDRIQLTLFLKELGLPLHDALLLWKHEYSMPYTAGDHKGWQGNERRYIYSIQHLYGLEGGRINYKAHSCSYIQGRSLCFGDHGGCPFVAKDETVLSSLTEGVGVKLPDIPMLEKLFENQDSTAACQLYMCLRKLHLVKKDDTELRNLYYHFKELDCKNVSADVQIGVEQNSDTTLKLCCRLDGTLFSDSSLAPFCAFTLKSSKESFNSNVHSHAPSRHSEKMSVYTGKVESRHGSNTACVKSSKLKRCSCVFHHDTTSKRQCSCINHLKSTCATEDAEGTHSLTESVTGLISYPSDPTITAISDVDQKVDTYMSLIDKACDSMTCLDTRTVHKDKHIHLVLGRHKKPSECFWIYQNSGCLVQEHSSHGNK